MGLVILFETRSFVTPPSTMEATEQSRIKTQLNFMFASEVKAHLLSFYRQSELQFMIS